MAGDFGVWVYAISDSIRREWLGDVTGLGGHPVYAVEAAGLAAAVTAVSLDEFGEQPLRRHLEDLAWLEAIARMHHHVIEIVADHRPVVPMRLATVYHHDAGVAAMLAARREVVAAALGRVTARTEWGVKVYAAQIPVTVAEPAAAASAGGAAASAGAAYLRRRRTELTASEDARQVTVASAEHVHTTLGRLAAAAQLRAPQAPQLTGQTGRMILNGAYLVDDEQSGDFAAAAAGLADRHPEVRIELTGPWPPYSFAAVDEHEAAV